MIVHMIGNAHLDPVWLWPWQSGADEALATFAHAVARCDETPQFIYTRGEAWLFSLVEKLDPPLFERARELVQAGRWQIVGNQWVQPDCNLPTLDGWNKQLEIGARYFEEKFGVKSRVGYNVDSFGHPATLPDILSAHGLENYCFHRPGPHQVELPAQTFRWRGVAGAEVIGFRIAQAYVTRTDDLYGQIQLALEAADEKLGHTMCFYGVGNHGGGPTKGNIEYILENRRFADDVELIFSHPQAFFDAIADEIPSLPVVETELQKTFPGCYSVMADIKRAQHRGEQFLAQTEAIVEHFSRDEAAKTQRKTRLEAAWRDLCFTQFHDILAGTSASQTWESVRAMQGRARIEGEEIALETTRIWARNELPPVNFQQIVLFNPNDETWRGVIEHEPFLDFDFWGSRWLS
ncbi:MAG: alpha-mannosidase, partial [Armatimonadetes bacterium]|nr:alpha-mannosidase [Armatimonadota bacterium]